MELIIKIQATSSVLCLAIYIIGVWLGQIFDHNKGESVLAFLLLMLIISGATAFVSTILRIWL